MSHGVSTVEEFHGQVWPDGIGVAAMPIGVNHIESVNVYLVADGDSVTLVDCGMWHPGEPDDGLTKLRDALNVRGYVLDDISRIIVTHAHIDHYGMAGRLMELTGAELLMHAMTDLDCEKYRHPETAQARKRDTYSDHGVPKDELPAYADTLAAWLPYLHSVVEASTRLQGGEIIPIGKRQWEVLHTPGHSLGHICLWSPADKLLFSGDHLLPAVTPPVMFERGFDKDPLRSYLGIAQAGRRARSRAGDAGPRPRIRGRQAPSRRHHTQQTTPARRHPRHDPSSPLHRA